MSMSNVTEGRYEGQLNDSETHRYAIELNAGDTLNASLVFANADGNLDLVVGRDTDSDRYLENPRERSTSNTDNEQVALTARTNDTYYIDVTGRDDTTNNSYVLHVDRVTPNETDFAEPNWNPASAAEVTEGRHQLNISTGDTDWYEVNLSAGDTLTVITRFSNSAGNLDLEVRRDTDGDGYYEYLETSRSNSDNELVAFTAKQNASYYIHVEGRDQYTTHAPYTLVLDRVTPNETAATEPNWDPASAAEISEGTYTDREITRGDTDWYEVNLSAGDTVNITARFSNTIGNLDLEVRRDTDDDGYYEYLETSHSNSDNEQVAFTAKQNGSYYIHIEGRNQYSTAASYNLTVDRVTPAETDPSEPNWDIQSAAPVTDGRFERELTVGDTDWYAIDLDPGDTVNISTLFNNSEGNLDLEIRADTDGDRYYEYIEDSHTNTDNEQLAFTARKNTTYYVHIDGRNQYRTSANYTLVVNRTTPNETDAAEPNWDIDSATRITEGKYDYEFPAGDTDWYKISLEAGDTLNVSALFENSDGNLDLEVRFDPDNDGYYEYLERSNTNSDNEQVAFTAKQTATYYIHIDGRNQHTTSANYTLVADRVRPGENDPTEPTYSPDSAAPLSDAGTNQNITRGDVDWYVVGLHAGETLTTTAEFDHSVGDLDMVLRSDTDQDGDLDYVDRARSNTDDETVSVTAQQAGFYYVYVYGDNDDRTAAPYNITTTASGAEPAVNVSVQRQELPDGKLNLSIVITNTRSNATDAVTVDIAQIGGDWTVENQSSEGGQWSSDFAWQWESIAGGESKRASLVISKRDDGRPLPRVATVTVSNSSIRTDAAVVSLWRANASESDDAPNVRFDWTPATPTPSDEVTFNASTTSGTAPLEYSWDLDSDGTGEATGETAARSFPVAGEYPVTLTVTDANGTTNSTTTFVAVDGPSREPNDERGNATAIIEGRYARNITAGDTDWYALNLSAGDTVNISLDFVHETGNLELVVGRNTDSDSYLEERWTSYTSSDDEQVAFTAQGNGTYYIKMVGHDDTTSAPYELSVDRVTPNETDPSEPNWNVASADRLTEGRYDREIVEGDTDWYKINLSAGDTLTAVTRFSNDAGNLDMEIRRDTDGDGYYEYVETAHSNSDNERVAFTARQNGSYYIHIDGRDQYSTSAPYTLILDRVTPSENDPSEPNWDIGSAAEITEGEYNRTLTTGDTDWYALDLHAGDTVNLSVLFEQSDGNLDLRVRSDTDDDGYYEYVEYANSNTDNEQVAFTAQENTTYYIHVDGRDQYRTSAPYTLDIDRVTPNETDATEPNWDIQSASTVTEGRYDVELTRGDRDWYALELNAGDTANVSALFEQSDGNLDLEIRFDSDNDGYYEYLEDSHTNSDNEQVAFTAMQTGTYYIYVDGRNQYTTAANYTLAIDRQTPAENDPDEPTYDWASAAPVTDGTVERNITRGDVDWYVIGLSAGELLETDLLFDNSQGNLDVEIRANTDDDRYLEYIDRSSTNSDNESITHRAQTTSLYYVKVTGRNEDTTAAPYDLFINTTGEAPPVDVQVTAEQQENGNVNLSIVVQNTRGSAAEDVTVDANQIGGNWRVENHSSEGGQWSSDLSWQWDSIGGGESRNATLVLSPRSLERSTPRFAVVEARNSSGPTDVEAASLWVGNQTGGAGGLQAQFSSEPAARSPGDEITFDANATESETAIGAYQWDLDSDGVFEQTGQTATRSFLIPGTFPVTLHVSNEDGQTDEVTNSVTVGDGNLDAHAPNGDQTNATHLIEGTYVGNITADDDDWYAINLSAGDTVNISTQFTHETGNLDLVVGRNTDGDRYLEDRWTSYTTSDNEQVAFTAQANGTYYIHVFGRDDTTTAPYELSVDRATPAENDPSEPNWDIQSAANITEGRYNRKVTAGDVDWYAIDLDAGDTLTVVTRFSNSAGNLDLRVRSDTDDDGYYEYVESSFSNSDTERVAFTAKQNGTYYINVEGRNQYTSSARYTLVANRVTPNETDNLEPNWDIDSASTVTEGSYDLEITPGDTDWYALELNAGDTVNLEARFNQSLGNLDLVVRANTDGDRYYEYIRDSHSNTDNEQLAFTATTNTTYYIHVEGRNQYTTSSPYELNIDRVTPNETDPSEPTWDITSADTLTEGRYAREITRGDTDWYAIQLNAGDTLNVSALFNHSDGNLDVQVRSNTDNDQYYEYIEDSDTNSDNEQLAFTARQNGTYYINVEGRQQDTTAANYTLVLDRVTPGENDPSEPTYSAMSADPVSPGTYNRSITRGDVDWYAIGLSEGETLNVSALFQQSDGNLDIEIRSNTDDDRYLEYIDSSYTNSDDEHLVLEADHTGVYYVKVDGRNDDTTAARYQLMVNQSGTAPPLELDVESTQGPNGTVNISIVVTNTRDTAASDVTVDGSQIGGNWRVVNNSSEGGIWGADITWQWESIAGGESKRATLVLAPRSSGLSTPRFATFEATNATARTDTVITSLWLADQRKGSYARAQFDWAPQEPAVSEQVTFNGTLSDGNTTIAEYHWDLDNDGTIEKTGPTVNHTFDETGDHLVSLHVRTENGATDTVTQRLSVNESEESTVAPNFQVRSLNAPSSVSIGEEFVVSAEIVNTGNAPGTQAVHSTLSMSGGVGGGEGLGNVTLAPGESTWVSVTFSTDDPNTTSFSAAIETANDSASTSGEFTTQQFVCGVSTGDPHFVTFDGVAYDFQGVGEFTLARATGAGDLVVQVRHIPVEGSTSVSITNATATIVDGHQVQIDASRDTPLSVDGEPVTVADGESVAVGNGTIKRSGNTYTVVYPGADGEATASDERLQVDVYSNRLDLKLCLDPAREHAVGGLLGSPNANASDDFALRNGTVLSPDIDTDTLYGSYRDSWRVTNNTTVFTYDDGKGPDTYYFPNYPERIVTLSDLNDTVRQRAEELAIEAGLEPGTAAFRDAVIDYALTGDSSYFASGRTAATNNIITDATEPDPMATAVELRPASVSTPNGTNVTYDVVVTETVNGVGAYTATVSVANGTVASVTNVSLNGDPGLQNVSYAADGTAIAFEGALANTNDTGEVTIATVTLETTAVGQTDINLSVAAVGNESGTSYNVTRTTGSTLESAGIEKLRDDYAGPPQDVDGDGVYEDINGDGEFNIVDVQALYNVRNDETVQANAARFDVNGDGVVDIVDVQALYVES